MIQISEIMDNIVDNFETLKLTVETADGCIVTSSIYPVSYKIENQTIYIYDDEMSETIINYKDAELIEDAIIIYGSNYVITLERSL